MGIACVCTYDTTTGLSRVFLEEDLGELAVYLYKKPTAGFNTKRFDNLLLAEHGVDVAPVIDGVPTPHYDMLEEIWVALGLNPDKFNPKTHGGWGLDAVCQATLGIAKTGHGALAPVWWQQGKRGKVIDYCLNDCNIEGRLLQWIIRHGWVTNNHKGQEPLLKVRRPALTCDPNFTEARRMASAGEPLINVESAYAKTPAAARDIRTVITPGLDESPSQVPLGGLGIIR
jgi:hypothetical protein